MNCSWSLIGTTEVSRRWRQLGALTLCCGEKSSHQKTGLDVGIVKSAVADPADVLAGYVSKMWSQESLTQFKKVPDAPALPNFKDLCVLKTSSV